MKSPKRSTEQNPSKASNVAANGTQESGNGDADTAATSMDAVTLIKNDHRKVEALFEEFESASSEDKKAEIAKQVCTELIIHAMIEEELFYPACREAEVEDDMLDEAQVEHDGVKVLIREIMAESPNEEFYDAKVKVLSEYVKHHVAEEEEPNNGILAKAQAADVDMDALGQKLQTRKAELMRKAESRGLGMPVPKTLLNQPPQKRGNQQEDSRMNRNTYAERDERGRFVSDDDDDRRRYSRSERDDDDRRSSRSRDERGRFESDDDRRSSSRRRDGDDDRRSSGGGRGWFGDSEGHSQAVRSRDDDVGARQLGFFATVQAIPLCIPFKAGTKSDASAWGDSNLPAPDSLLVKVTTDQGLVRWGEAFGFRAVMSGVFYIGLGQTSMTSKRKSGTGVGSGRASTTT